MDIQQTVTALKINAACGISTLLEGNHGIAKSAVVKMHALKNLAAQHGAENVGFIDIRLSQMDVGDLKGIPYRVNGTTYFAPPSWFPVHETNAKQISAWLEPLGEKFSPMNNKPYGVLLLDEMNRGTREVLQCAFELVLDRSLGGLKIPDGWQVVACVNSNQDIYQVAALDAALTNRFQLINFTPSHEDWFTWAKEEMDAGRFHSAVFNFLQMKPEKMDPSPEAIIEAAESTDKGEALGTRRSWSNCAFAMQRAADSGFDLTDLDNQKTAEFFMEFSKGFLGSNLATSFSTWIRTEYKTLNAKEVLDKMHLPGNKTLSHLKRLVGQGDRVHEITGLNNDILAELKNRGATLTDTETGNITTYIEVVPNEVAMGLFTPWMAQNNKQCSTAYDWQEKRAGKPKTNKDNKPSTPFKARIYACSAKGSVLAKK